MARRRKSKLARFFNAAQEAAEDVLGAGEKKEPEKKGFYTLGAEKAGGYKKWVTDETGRAIFGIVGFYGTNVTNGVIKRQQIASDYPIISLLASVGLVYFLGTLITNNQQFKKAVLLGALINVGLQIAKEYGGLAAENAQLSGQLNDMARQQAQYADNVLNYNQG